MKFKAMGHALQHVSNFVRRNEWFVCAFLALLFCLMARKITIKIVHIDDIYMFVYQ